MPATSRKPLHKLLTERKVMAGGYERSYLIHMPSTAGLPPSSLVMMLHGAGDTARGAACQTRWHEKAEKEGFIAVFPDALRENPDRPAQFDKNSQIWNDGSAKGFAYERGVDDCAFLASLAQQLMSEFRIPARRALVTGFSNGGGMAFRLGNSAADVFGAAAPVCGHFWSAPVAMKHPVALYYLVGQDDPLNPLAGGRISVPWGVVVKPPAIDSLRKWTALCSCPDVPLATLSSGGVTTEVYGPCGGGARVSYVRIAGAGHVWPGGRNLLPREMAGNDTLLLDATDAIWEFFAALGPRQHVVAPKGALK